MLYSQSFLKKRSTIQFVFLRILTGSDPAVEALRLTVLAFKIQSEVDDVIRPPYVLKLRAAQDLREA